MTTTALAPATGLISGTTPSSTSTPSSTTANATSTTGTNGTLAGNFQTFLTLLTTQLQNQNPLDPLDTNQFTQQLVQFAGVEQQLRTNDQLSSLVTLQQNTQVTQALGFVGKTALVDGNSTTLTNGSATWLMDVPNDSTVQVSITNSVGQTVFTKTVPMSAGSSQPFTWDGKGADGTQWPVGTYTMTASAKDASGNAVGINTQIKGVVTSVDLTQTPPLLLIGGRSYTIDQVKGITTTDSTTTLSNPGTANIFGF